MSIVRLEIKIIVNKVPCIVLTLKIITPTDILLRKKLILIVNIWSTSIVEMMTTHE